MLMVRELTATVLAVVTPSQFTVMAPAAPVPKSLMVRMLPAPSPVMVRVVAPKVTVQAGTRRSSSTSSWGRNEPCRTGLGWERMGCLPFAIMVARRATHFTYCPSCPIPSTPLSLGRKTLSSYLPMHWMTANETRKRKTREGSGTDQAAGRVEVGEESQAHRRHQGGPERRLLAVTRHCQRQAELRGDELAQQRVLAQPV